MGVDQFELSSGRKHKHFESAVYQRKQGDFQRAPRDMWARQLGIYSRYGDTDGSRGLYLEASLRSMGPPHNSYDNDCTGNAGGGAYPHLERSAESLCATPTMIGGPYFSAVGPSLPIFQHFNRVVGSQSLGNDNFGRSWPSKYAQATGEQVNIDAPEMITSWYRRLNLDEPEVSRLAAHIWNRASSARLSKSPELKWISEETGDDALARLAACFWISYKISNKRCPVLSAANFKLRLGMPRIALGANELETLKLLDWRPLKGFLSSET